VSALLLQDGVFKTPLKEVVAVDCGCDHFYALAQILFAGGGDPPLKLLLDLGEAGNEIVSPLTFVVALAASAVPPRSATAPSAWDRRGSH